jgi:hypothetical protein
MFCNRRNNLIIIKTSSNKLIISFIEPPLCSTSDRNVEKDSQKAIIMVCDDGTLHVYHLKEDKITFEFTQMHLLIGKSDLRVDLAKATLTSNLGQSDSQFESNGKKGKQIIGG